MKGQHFWLVPQPLPIFKDQGSWFGETLLSSLSVSVPALVLLDTGPSFGLQPVSWPRVGPLVLSPSPGSESVEAHILVLGASDSVSWF